jgi:hypothetical protein
MLDPVARVVAIAPDLFFASKIEATLSAAGHEVGIASGLDDFGAERPDLLIVDLDNTDFGVGVPADMPTLGFYSHVDTETKLRAADAGFDLVVPRSRMAREMPGLVARLLGST